MHIVSISGNWCRAKLLETGEEGKIPSENVVEPKSLDTERQVSKSLSPLYVLHTCTCLDRAVTPLSFQAFCYSWLL